MGPMASVSMRPPRAVTACSIDARGASLKPCHKECWTAEPAPGYGSAMRARSWSGLALAPCLAAAAARAQPVPLGPQFEVTSGGPPFGYSDVAIAADGDFMVVWQEVNGIPNYNVLGRIFSANETPQG